GGSQGRARREAITMPAVSAASAASARQPCQRQILITQFRSPRGCLTGKTLPENPASGYGEICYAVQKPVDRGIFELLCFMYEITQQHWLDSDWRDRSNTRPCTARAPLGPECRVCRAPCRQPCSRAECN